MCCRVHRGARLAALGPMRPRDMPIYHLASLASTQPQPEVSAYAEAVRPALVLFWKERHPLRGLYRAPEAPPLGETPGASLVPKLGFASIAASTVRPSTA